jgi:nitrite reductase/ring-hydroxylating ferredoxin subunit
MLTSAQNERMTRTDKATPGGKLMRQYWQPVMLIDELPEKRPVKALEVMGQQLVAFRDEQGRYGLMDRDCPHRGADLAFGRLENGGLRCAFHGWLFDVNGKCLETPGEPGRSRLCEKVSQRSYPVAERAGVLFAYLGEGAPPAFPAMDCFRAPDSHVFAFKGYLDCNWVQALEVGIDPAHASFLHRFFEDESIDTSYGKQFRGASVDSDMPMTKILRDYQSPDISIEKSSTGFQLTALRMLDGDRTHVRITNLIFPNAFVIPLSGEIAICQWHVPINDYSCYWFAIFTSFTDPLDKAQMRAQRLELYELPDYKPRRHRGNDYGFSVDEQQAETYTGMGLDINVHDSWAIESQGRIQDRTREHLGQTDKGIVAYRKMLFAELAKAEVGERSSFVFARDAAGQARGPRTIDLIAPAEGWEQHWVRRDDAVRGAAAWPATINEPAEA